MPDPRFEIDADIRKARTPPSELYTSASWFARQRDKVFPRCWHFVSHSHGLDEPGTARPFVLLEGCLDVPLLLVRDLHGELRGLSNVCTHRGNLIVEGEWKLDSLRCRYHGRRFHLDGTFAYTPGFEKAEGFPSKADYLPKVPVAAWRGLIFSGLRPALNAEDMVAPIEKRLDGLGVTDWRFVPNAGGDYTVDANWVLYCDNALEGFHTDSIHAAFGDRHGRRRHPPETWSHGSVRLIEARDGEATFDLPRQHPDYGERVAAYHFWIFPATFLNVHPWGLLLVSVQPVDVTHTRIRHRVFVGDPAKVPDGLMNDLHHREIEDEAVVSAVQRGMRSQLYAGGRYAPEAEGAVHSFHRLLAGWMAGGAGPA